MALTPSDVQQKTFGPELRGYNMDEVDDFLDEIVGTLTEYERRLAAASDKARRAEVAPGTPPAPTTAAAPAPDESVISRTLVTAQQAADSLLENAQTEADSLVARARADADDLKAGAQAERERTMGEIDRLRGSVVDLRTRLSSLASSVDEDLVAMETAIEETTGIAVFETEEEVAAPVSEDEEEDEVAVGPVEDPEETMVIDREEPEESAPPVEPEPEDTPTSNPDPSSDDEEEAFGEFDPWGDTTEQEQMDLGVEDEKPRRPWER